MLASRLKSELTPSTGGFPERAGIYKKFCVLCAILFLQLFAQQIAIKASRQTASCLSPHTALGESPRTSLPRKESPKGAATEAFRGLLLARPPSLSGLGLPPALSLGSCPARICCSRDRLQGRLERGDEDTSLRSCSAGSAAGGVRVGRR